MGHFPAKLRLLHQLVEGGLHCIVLNYEARLCYSRDTNRYYEQLGTCFFKKCNITTLQSVYGCLSVYRHNVSPNFYIHCLFKRLLLLLPEQHQIHDANYLPPTNGIYAHTGFQNDQA